ncbi:Hypothetical predicted protein [Mytilus galloprovincialis]|uniref:MAM domain-containing protein n=1 Tax=Mytilus galloprovincialis TaxID=29158 RepID=A0A8B6ETV0_MYTGA|nr:Hypothetical predicted protein [Mytilus galloprovincialis]
MPSFIFILSICLLEVFSERIKATIDCNFDNDLCEWRNKADSCFNWTIGNGKTGDKTSGPIADHTTGSSNGSYALIYGRRSHNSSCSAVIQSPSFYVTENSILSFWYHMNGNGIGSLNVYLVSKHTRQRIWQKTGRQSPDWLLANIPVSPGASKIEMEATAKYHFGSDLAVDDITLRKAPPSLQRTTTTLSPTTIQIAALPINCNFEDGLCGFRTYNSNFSSASWTRKNGTESLGKFTFLHGDNTTGSGSYLSLAIDNNRALIADRASLYIPAIRSQKMVCLTFAYSLPSHTSGVIQIFQTGTTTGNATLMKQLSGYHGLYWKSTFVQFLPSFEPMKIVIEGYYSGEPGCVVTLDDIHLVEGICDVQESKRTTRAVTTTFRPTTKTSPAIVFNKTSSCPSEYFGLLNELSCDFTSNLCNYTTINSPIHWQRKKGAGGNWIARIPERKNTLSGYYLTLNISTYAVRHGEGILKTPENKSNLSMFWNFRTVARKQFRYQS